MHVTAIPILGMCKNMWIPHLFYSSLVLLCCTQALLYNHQMLQLQAQVVFLGLAPLTQALQLSIASAVCNACYIWRYKCRAGVPPADAAAARDGVSGRVVSDGIVCYGRGVCGGAAADGRERLDKALADCCALPPGSL